jgi:hypothetical protein
VLFIGFYSRMLRSNMLDAMNEDYVRTARAKGLSERGADPSCASQLDDSGHHAIRPRLRTGGRRRRSTGLGCTRARPSAAWICRR